MTNTLKILIAEDESSISMQYELVLKERGHEVVITANGEECLSRYVSSLQTAKASIGPGLPAPSPPFDLVVLDYRMPKMDGLEAAERILALCPSQRLMFASAYTAQTLMEAVKSLHKVVELLQKPFDLEYFVDAVEDKALYEQLERLNVRVRALKDHNVTHSQLLGLLAGVQKLHEMVLRD
jgi:two-component system chemotaxis response regulator CheY/two-component system cell cycle response regulator CpdR